MTTTHKVMWALAAIVFVFVGYNWLKSHDAALTMQTQLAADKDAEARISIAEETNQENLKTQLATQAQQKIVVQTPAQIVKAVPTYITLPAPIHEVTQAEATAAKAADLPDAPAAGDLVIPAVSAKAFFDAQVDCKMNATKLDSCQQTTQNDIQLLAVKDTEIKQYQQQLKGGTFWQRTKTALKYTGIGIGIGATVVLAVHH